MISSPSAQIVNAIAEKHFVTAVDGERAEAYGPTMAIATVIIALGIIVTTMLGPEKKGRRFELAKAAGAQEMEIRDKLGSDAGMEQGEAEKVVEERVEVGEAEKK